MIHRPKLAKTQRRNATLLTIAAHQQREHVEAPPLRMITSSSIALYYSGGTPVFKFIKPQNQQI